MARIVSAPSGRLLLAGGRFLTHTPAAAVQGSPLISLTLNDFLVGQSLAEPIVQRKAGTDVGDVWIRFNFTGGDPANINVQARVVSADGGAEILTWTALTDISISGTTGLGKLAGVPMGCEYNTQLRDGSQPANTATISNGSLRWGVGVRVIASGQSNMQQTLKAGAYNNIVPGGSGQEERYYWLNAANAPGYFGPDSYTVPQSIGGTGTNVTGPGNNPDAAAGGSISFPRLLSAALSAKYGRKIPVCLIPWAQGSTGIASFLKGQTLYTRLFLNSGTTVGNFGLASPGIGNGDFEGVVWHQGEADDAMTRTAYKANLIQLYTDYLAAVAPYGRTAQHLFFLPAVLGVYTGVTHIENIRGAVMDFDAYARANNWPKCRIGWTTIDCDPSAGADPLHFADPYSTWSHRRMVTAALNMIDVPDGSGGRVPCSQYGARGPRIVSVTRSGLTATFTVEHDGGTALTLRNSGAAITGHYANKQVDFKGAAVTIDSSAITGANTFTATFAAGTTFPVYFKNLGGDPGTQQSCHPDVSNVICDNRSYPPAPAIGTDVMTNGLPLLPTPDAIQVN